MGLHTKFIIHKFHYQKWEIKVGNKFLFYINLLSFLVFEISLVGTHYNI